VRFKQVRRRLALVGVIDAALVAASPASAAIFMRLATVHVQPGGVVRIFGNPRHMPLYALPVRKMPCVRSHTCPGVIHRTTVPRRPFVLLGRAPGRAAGSHDYAPRAFTVRLPRALSAGKYVVFVWCASCGGSLISAGTNASGQPQILDVRR
jgi:hypothetical protein